MYYFSPSKLLTTVNCALCGRDELADGEHGNGDLKRCSRCKKALYCGAACQKKDWPRHKKECFLPYIEMEYCGNGIKHIFPPDFKFDKNTQKIEFIEAKEPAKLEQKKKNGNKKGKK